MRRFFLIVCCAFLFVAGCDRADDVGQKTSLSGIRRLIGDSFPRDFAEALVVLERSCVELSRRNDTLRTAQILGDEQGKSIGKITPAAFWAYFPPDRVKSDSFTVVDFSSSDNGFSATAFKDTEDRVIIAFRGSDDLKDLADAQRILSGKMPLQYESAQAFYQKVRKQYPGREIAVTGHSLGGSLAQMIAVRNPDVRAFPCNPVGTKSLMKEDVSDGRVFNLVVRSDPFSSALPQVGHSFLREPVKTNSRGEPLHPHSVFYCYYP